MFKKTRLLEQIEAKTTGRNIPMMPLVDVKYQKDETPTAVWENYGVEYRIGVNLGASFVIPKNALENAENSSVAQELHDQRVKMETERARIEIAEMVYGEVRQGLQELRKYSMGIHGQLSDKDIIIKMEEKINELLEMTYGR